jgi:hypothetical protein
MENTRYRYRNRQHPLFGRDDGMTAAVKGRGPEKLNRDSPLMLRKTF